MAEWTAGQVIAGLLSVLGIGALIAWWFREFLVTYLPRLNPARLGRAARGRDLPLPSGERFVVMIADLQGVDADKSQTRYVAAALAPYRGLDVQRIGVECRAATSLRSERPQPSSCTAPQAGRSKV